MKSLKVIKRISSFNMLVVFFIGTCFSCKTDDADTGSYTVTLQSVIDNLGGIDVIKKLENISYTSTGTAYEHEQDGPNQAEEHQINQYSYDLISLIGERKLNINYTKNLALFPFTYNSPKTQVIIDNKKGSLEGEYNFGSIYLGFNRKVPLSSARMEALLKVQLMSNPLALIKALSQTTDVTTKVENGVFELSTIIDGLKIKLEVNPKTKLPEKATVLESDFMFGDTSFTVNYANWESVGSTKYPKHITHTFKNDVLREETITNIKINGSLSDDSFTLPNLDTELTYNEANAKKGYMFSQWYQRMFYMHLTLDQDLSTAFLLERADLSQFNLKSQKVSDHIKIIGRPDVTIWGVAIKTSKGVYFVDAPINNTWAKGIINVAKNVFPNETLMGVIPTHTHGTHISGIREFAANMEHIYVGKSGQSFVENVLESKHTLHPDAYASSTKTNVIHPIDEKEIIGDNEIIIYDFSHDDTSNNPHSEDLVAVYIPKDKTLIQTDFYYSGFAENVFHNKTMGQFAEPIKQSLKKRSQFVLKFIKEQQLDVQIIISTHGGVGTIQDIRAIANY